MTSLFHSNLLGAVLGFYFIFFGLIVVVCNILKEQREIDEKKDTTDCIENSVSNGFNYFGCAKHGSMLLSPCECNKSKGASDGDSTSRDIFNVKPNFKTAIVIGSGFTPYGYEILSITNTEEGKNFKNFSEGEIRLFEDSNWVNMFVGFGWAKLVEVVKLEGASFFGAKFYATVNYKHQLENSSKGQSEEDTTCDG